MIWKLRNQIAKNQEERQAQEHTPIDEHPLGFKTQENPFLAILDEIETT